MAVLIVLRDEQPTGLRIGVVGRDLLAAEIRGLNEPSGLISVAATVSDHRVNDDVLIARETEYPRSLPKCLMRKKYCEEKYEVAHKIPIVNESCVTKITYNW